jgi:hypothetical protein
MARAPLPDFSDYHRFVLSRPELDGLLASPSTPEEVEALAAVASLNYPVFKGPATL